MTYYDLTAYQRVRLTKNPACLICGNLIYYDENLTFDKHRIGKKLVYNFYHERCFTDGKKQEVVQKAAKEADSKATAKTF